MFWFDLTWEKVKDLDRDKVFLILPIGSCEQHSLHLPLGMDTYSAYQLSKDVAKAFDGSAYILPPIWYGLSEHHMDFSGTITISPQTLINMVYEIGESLKRHGFKRLVIINGHGGNVDALKVAIRRLRKEVGLLAILINPWELINETIEKVLETKIWGHACEFETSIAYKIIPDKIVKERIVDPEIDKRMHERMKNMIYPWKTSEITNTGSIGYPTKATLEKGEKLYKAMLEKTIEAIKMFLEVDVGGGER